LDCGSNWIIDDQIYSAFDKVAGHSLAHPAEANEASFAGCSVTLHCAHSSACAATYTLSIADAITADCEAVRVPNGRRGSGPPPKLGSASKYC
jgi:hypothetical protein